MSGTILAGKQWLLLLFEFDVEYITRKVIKGRAVAEFLANQPLELNYVENLEFPDEQLAVIDEAPKWEMYFDGAVNRKGAGLGVIIKSPEGGIIPLSKRLTFFVANNGAKYEVCLFGLTSVQILGEEEEKV